MKEELQLGKYEFFPYDFENENKSADEIYVALCELLKDLEESENNEIITN